MKWFEMVESARSAVPLLSRNMSAFFIQKLKLGKKCSCVYNHAKLNELKWYRLNTKGIKKSKMSRKAKLNELKWYRLKAKKKMKSQNPKVRIRYKLEKVKRKEEWLIEKLRKFEILKAREVLQKVYTY